MFVQIRIILQENNSKEINWENDYTEKIVTESNLLKLYAERDKQNIPIKIQVLDERPVEDDWSDIVYFLEKRTNAKF